MSQMNRLLFCLLVFGLSQAALAFQCPYTIMVSESVVPEANWSNVKMSTAKTLSGWTIYEGTLGDTQFALAPEEIKRKGTLIQHWEMDAKKNYWIQCNYFETPMSMSQAIPKHVKECKSIMILDKQHNIAKSANVDCE
jgi:hypothetical protein